MSSATFSYSVPFVGNHSSMVIGSKGKCIKSLQQEFGVDILAMKADHQKNLPVPYFLIVGNERSVLLAALKVHSLLSISMGRTEKELNTEIEKLIKDNEEMIGIIHDMDNSPEIDPSAGSYDIEYTNTATHRKDWAVGCDGM
jgi:hypothetical protein